MSTPHKTPQRPNIILIMTDQQRTDTIAAWGHVHMVTPNLDRLSSSTYWNAGYRHRRARTTNFLMRRPTEQDVNLHGRPSVENPFPKTW